MAKPNDFTKEKNVVVSASIGISLYNLARELQQKGIEEANWSNAMRRGLKTVIDIASGSTQPEDAIKRLRLKLEEVSRENEELKSKLNKGC